VGGCKKRFKENSNFLEGLKRGALKSFGWRRSVSSCDGLKWIGSVVSC